MRLKGIPISEGIAIAPILKVEDVKLNTSRKKITDYKREIELFKAALMRTIEQLDALVSTSKKRFLDDTVKIFEAQKTIALDKDVTDAICKMIEEDRINAAYAIETVTNQYLSLFDHINDTYLQERAEDVKDVSNRLIKNVLDLPIIDFAGLKEKVIVATTTITPSDMARIDPKYVKGIVTRFGGRTSHSAIIARLLGIPTVFGQETVLDHVKTNDLAIIDGTHGEIVLEPSTKTKAYYETEIEEIKKLKKELKTYVDKPSITADGSSLGLMANITSKKDLSAVKRDNADGVGLFRTEFLFLNRTSEPSETEQFEEYKAVLEGMFPKEVIIRTVDIGGDKRISYLEQEHELNPFLGVRGIRLSLRRPKLFKIQLRALLQASVYGNLRIMFPMITTKEEFLQAKTIVLGVKNDLLAEGIKIAHVPLGAMIEVPASALLAQSLASVADFFSIGTNDLIQYTMAADRTNRRLNDLYQPFNPALLSLIERVATAAKAHGIPVGVCGEMASDLRVIPILIGLGIDEFSMVPKAILPMRQHIHTLDRTSCKHIADLALKQESEKDVIDLIESRVKGRHA